MSERADASDAEQQASRWIARLESADVTLDDHKSFRQWLAASTDNKAAYKSVSGTWDKLDALRHLAPHATTPRPPKPNRRLLLLASVGIAAVGGAAILLPRLLKDRGARYETGVGERNTITLADKSTVELNASAKLRVDYKANERRLYLDDGEAFFDVQPDPTRPFIVETRFGSVRVVGTSFVVRIGPDGARTTVIHGTVEGLANHAARPVVATASQEISFTSTGATGQPLTAPVLERRLAWREGMLAFDGEPLREATIEIERQTGVRFQFAEADLGDLRVGGYINATDLEAFLLLLDNNLGIEAQRDNPSVISLSRRK